MRMFRARSSRAVPAELAKEFGLGRSDRVLAWSVLAGGGAAVATVSELKIKKPDGAILSRPWGDVDHAAWEADSSTIAVWWAGQRMVTPLEVDAHSRLPEVIRERVQSSVLLAGSVTVPGGRQVRIALRKTADGGIRTQALPPPGVRLADPAVAEVVDAALAALRAEAAPDGDALGLAFRPDPAPDPEVGPEPDPEPDLKPDLKPDLRPDPAAGLEPVAVELPPVAPEEPASARE
jgi:hypothetical protein